MSAGAMRPTTPGCESIESAPDDAVALERGDELKAVVVQEAKDRHFALGRQAAQVELDLTTATETSAVSFFTTARRECATHRRSDEASLPPAVPFWMSASEKGATVLHADRQVSPAMPDEQRAKEAHPLTNARAKGGLLGRTSALCDSTRGPVDACASSCASCASSLASVLSASSCALMRSWYDCVRGRANELGMIGRGSSEGAPHLASVSDVCLELGDAFEPVPLLLPRPRVSVTLEQLFVGFGEALLERGAVLEKARNKVVLRRDEPATEEGSVDAVRRCRGPMLTEPSTLLPLQARIEGQQLVNRSPRGEEGLTVSQSRSVCACTS